MKKKPAKKSAKKQEKFFSPEEIPEVEAVIEMRIRPVDVASRARRHYKETGRPVPPRLRTKKQ